MHISLSWSKDGCTPKTWFTKCKLTSEGIMRAFYVRINRIIHFDVKFVLCFINQLPNESSWNTWSYIEISSSQYFILEILFFLSYELKIHHSSLGWVVTTIAESPHSIANLTWRYVAKHSTHYSKALSKKIWIGWKIILWLVE